MFSVGHNSTMEQDHPHGYIKIRGAKVHNLKNIDVDLPRNQLVVLTGLSGSGKSSLAFDTIYAEGQRRYVESLSTYARQFLDMQEKPDVELIEGLSPAISIEQKTTSKNPRSTVATVTEIYDYLRLLYARTGKVYCHQCGQPIVSRSPSQIVDAILQMEEGTRISILSPLVRERKGEYKKELQDLQKEGFVRVRVDGVVRELEEEISLDKQKKHSIDIVVDRITVRKDARARISDSVELAVKKAKGLVTIVIHTQEGGKGKDTEELHSTHFACTDCGISYPELEPRMFSFNAPQGACPSCTGLGEIHSFDVDKVIPDPSLSIKDGAIKPWGGVWEGWHMKMLETVAKAYKFKLTVAWKEMTKETQKIVLYGADKELNMRWDSKSSGNTYQFNKKFEGVMPNLARRLKETQSDGVRAELEKYMVQKPCEACNGARLKKEARHVKVGDLGLHEYVKLSIGDADLVLEHLKFGKRDEPIAEPLLKEIRARLGFLLSVGLGYLTLDRSAGTLSGGEAQRIRLASQIGSGLVGVLYVLDEPSIGLHQRDNDRLLGTLRRLRDLGNTVIVVEHDEDTIMASDHVVDLGPGAGIRGGHIVSQGTPASIMKDPKSLTGAYLARRERIEPKTEVRKGSGKHLFLKGASGNNLKKVDVEIPLGMMVAVTGVSGSGKSSLILDTLLRAVQRHMELEADDPLRYSSIKGLEHVDKVVEIDQSPIGRTPRSNPVTYTGVFDEIRKLFAMTPDAQRRGYDQGRFSFNVSGGRCESCQGDGVLKIDMNFLADVYVTCEVCGGARYNADTLSVLFKGKNIAEVLKMTVAEALEFFGAIPQIARKIKTLDDVGLSYIQLGQSATTLSGGEAQRIKLSKELSKRSTGNTLYVLDEPTTGLHIHDVKQLLEVLHRLVDQGNSVLVIEHNLDVIKTADWVIDMGPEGGDGGGLLIAKGTPMDMAKHHTENSFTAEYLKQVLKRDGVLK